MDWLIQSWLGQTSIALWSVCVADICKAVGLDALFYFTGTGNCLSVTKKLEERFSEEINTIRICKKNMELAKKQYRDVVGTVYTVLVIIVPLWCRNFLNLK